MVLVALVTLSCSPSSSCATSKITRQPCDTPVPTVTSISFAHYSAGSHSSGCHTLGLFPPNMFLTRTTISCPRTEHPTFPLPPSPSPFTPPQQKHLPVPAQSSISAALLITPPLHPELLGSCTPDPAAALPSEHLMPTFSPHPASKMPLSSSSALDYALSRLLLPDTRNLSSPKLRQNSIPNCLC